MAKAPPDTSDWTSLPVLTEVVGDAPPEIPTLTEEALNKRKLAQSLVKNIVRDHDALEMSAEEIAALLAPQLEQQMREKMREHFEVLWQETWLQTRASLPELIYAQLKPGSKGVTGGKASAVGIITPQPAATGTKKSATGKAAAAKAKDSKNK